MKKAILSLVILTFSISLNAQQKFTSVVQFMDSLAIWTKKKTPYAEVDSIVVKNAIGIRQHGSMWILIGDNIDEDAFKLAIFENRFTKTVSHFSMIRSYNYYCKELETDLAITKGFLESSKFINPVFREMVKTSNGAGFMYLSKNLDICIGIKSVYQNGKIYLTTIFAPKELYDTIKYGE